MYMKEFVTMGENDDRGGSVKCKQIDMYSKL